LNQPEVWAHALFFVGLEHQQTSIYS
jgi:hypothetical protein